MVHINEEMMSNKIKYVPQCSCLQTKQILSLFCKLLWDELQLNSGMSQGVYEWIKAEPDIHKMLSPWQYLIKNNFAMNFLYCTPKSPTNPEGLIGLKCSLFK